MKVQRWVAIVGLLVFSTGVLGATPSIEGRWVSDCLAVGIDHALEERVFEGDTFTEVFISYHDSECKKPFRATIYEGTFELTGPAMVEPGAMNIDFHYQREGKAFYHPDWIEYHNEEKLCGFSDWKVAELRWITGLECQSEESYGKFPSTVKSVFLQRSNALIMGDLFDDPKLNGRPNRPKALDSYFILYKK